MAKHIVKYVLMLVVLLVGASDIGAAIKGFVSGKYFVGGVESMFTVWMICLFVRIFFEM